MICNVIDKDFYIIKILNNWDDFNIYDHNEIKEFVQSLFDKILKKYKLCGNIIFNIFLDKLYGIIEIKKESDLLIKNLVDIKIKFNLNVSFLYEIDYFYLIDNNVVNQNIYYYNDKFYLEIINDIKEEEYLKLLDNSLIIYNDKINDIIDYGIKLKCITDL